MNKKFIFSILLNVFFLFASSIIVYNKRVRIRTILYDELVGQKVTQKKRLTIKEQALLQFNNDPLEALNDSMIVGSDTTVTFLFLGNSLTYTSPVKEYNDKSERGMASSSKEKDYVHVLLNRISEEKHVNIKYSLLNIAQFERTFTKYSFDVNKIKLVENKKPDFLIVQIGENIAYEDVKNTDKFMSEFVKLLSLFPNSSRIILIPFWTNVYKQYATTNVAILTGSYLVDISHLGNGTDTLNFAHSFQKFENEMVGMHPSDYGMKNIADCIYATFNAIYCSKINNSLCK